MTTTEIMTGRPECVGYRVDVSRGERVGRVSSEWFSRPDDERYLSLDDGSVRISVCGRSVKRHGQAMARVKRWPKSTANWAFAMAHSRGGMVHSFSVLFKTR